MHCVSVFMENPICRKRKTLLSFPNLFRCFHFFFFPFSTAANKAPHTQHSNHHKWGSTICRKIQINFSSFFSTQYAATGAGKKIGRLRKLHEENLLFVILHFDFDVRIKCDGENQFASKHQLGAALTIDDVMANM